MYTMEPSAFVAPSTLSKSCACPECSKSFTVKDGAANFTYFKRTDTGENHYGLVIFCSTQCLLGWETPATMYSA